MKLYKFRPLATCTDLTRAQSILETGRFWHSKFWELNDPMEGVYWFDDGALDQETIDRLYDMKSSHAICSFSGKDAFKDPIMWGHYANGFKGVAIEVEIADDCVEEVQYESEVSNVIDADNIEDTVRRILTTKLKCWQPENEYRHLCEDNGGSHPIGTIKGLYFGNPYKTNVNADDARRRPRIREYLCRMRSLQETAAACDPPVPCHSVDVTCGRVVKVTGEEAV